MKIEIDPQELEKLLDTIVALETRMLERNVKSVNIKNGKVDYGWDSQKHKPIRICCCTCAYECVKINESPCNTCGLEEGRYDNWKKATEVD